MTAHRTPPRWILPALLIWALGLRLLGWNQTFVMMNDGPDFLWQAARWLEGDALAAVAHPYHPLYGALIALTAPVAGGLERAGAAVSIVGGVALVWAAWHIGRLASLDTPWAAPATAFVAAIHTRTIAFSSDVQSEGVFMGLFGLGMWALLAATRQPRRLAPWCVAGLLTALAYLTRQEGLLLAFPLVLACLSGVRREPRVVPWRGAAAFTLVLGLCLLPYAWGLRQATGHWSLSFKPSMTALGLGEAVVWPLPSAVDSPMGAPKIRRLKDTAPAPAPTPAPTPVRKGGYAPWAESDVVPLMVLGSFLAALRVEGCLLLLLGLRPMWRARPRLTAAGLATMAVYFALCVRHERQFGFLSVRHMIAPMLLTLPVMGAGLVTLVRGSPAGLPRKLAWMAVLLGYVSLTYAGTHPRRTQDAPRLEALAWTAGITAPDERIAVHRKRDGWYAGRPVLVLRLPCDQDELTAALRQHQVTHLVLDRAKVERWAPHWLDGQGYEVLATFEDDEGDPVVVLRTGSR